MASGRFYDVRDLDVSFDGTKLMFSMRRRSIKNAKESQQPTLDDLRVRRRHCDRPAGHRRPDRCELGHDVVAALPARRPHRLRLDRQHDAKAVLIDEGKEGSPRGIEGNRNRAGLRRPRHDADGTSIHQISFNTGHDLDPSVLNDGRIVFTRWDINSGGRHAPVHDRSDGGDVQLLYGRNSHDSGTPDVAQALNVQFTQARARQDGKVVALKLPFAGTDFGGDLALIDSANFVENTQTVLGATNAPAPPARHRSSSTRSSRRAADADEDRVPPPPPSPAAGSRASIRSGTAPTACWSAGPSAVCSTRP